MIKAKGVVKQDALEKHGLVSSHSVDPGSPSLQSFAFARHETFHLREGWLFKALDALSTDESALHAQDAHHRLGLGVNMLKSLIYWVQATNLAQLRKKEGPSRAALLLTPLGQLVCEEDPYFEDPRTLWLLHIELCSNRAMATMWYWVFNELARHEFTEERLMLDARHFLEENQAKGVAESSIAKDIRCFLRTYLISLDGADRKTSPYDAIRCPLASLGVLRRSAITGHYKLQIGDHKSLPPSVFLYALYKFRDMSRSGQLTLSIEDVRRAPLSPGRLLCLDGSAIASHLERIEATTMYARVIRTADLNMISLKESVGAADLLTECYRSED